MLVGINKNILWYLDQALSHKVQLIEMNFDNFIPSDFC